MSYIKGILKKIIYIVFCLIVMGISVRIGRPIIGMIAAILLFKNAWWIFISLIWLMFNPLTVIKVVKSIIGEVNYYIKEFQVRRKNVSKQKSI